MLGVGVVAGGLLAGGSLGFGVLAGGVLAAGVPDGGVLGALGELPSGAVSLADGLASGDVVLSLAEVHAANVSNAAATKRTLIIFFIFTILI